MTDDLVRRPEFDRVVADHERRLDGHDSLYGDMRRTREEMVKFMETLRHARGELDSTVADRDKCRVACAGHRERFDGRIRSLERFRWQIGGALVVLSVIVPLLVKYAL